MSRIRLLYKLRGQPARVSPQLRSKFTAADQPQRKE